jgi:hypothetical protein
MVEWLWDPHIPPFDFAYYAIGWKNVTSMVFMLICYLGAAAFTLASALSPPGHRRQ